jgi:hypothetical protein
MSILKSNFQEIYVLIRTPFFQSLLGERTTKREILRYSASKLHQKGILLSIDGLPENQFKNVMFEIAPMHTSNGQFQIHAKFMGKFFCFVFSKKDILFSNIYSYFLRC